MEIFSSVTAFSHILNIKEKLFPRQRELTSTTTDDVDTARYFSVLLEHAYDPRNTISTSEDVIEIVLTKRSEFSIPIRHLDWVFMEHKLDNVCLIDFERPELWVIDHTGFLVNAKLEGILKGHIEYLGLKGRGLKKELESMGLQITYGDGYKQVVPVPKSLKESLYRYYESINT